MGDVRAKLISLSMLLFVVFSSMPSNAIDIAVTPFSDRKKQYTIKLDDSATIWSLKEWLFAETGIPIYKQRIIAAGRQAKNNEKISDIPETNRSPFYVLIIDNLLEARNNFNTHLENGDHEMALAIIHSIVVSDNYTEEEKDEAQSWLGKMPK